MPLVDVTAPIELLPTDTHDALRSRLGKALLRAEGAPLVSPYLENTGVFLHELPSGALGTADQPQDPVVRVQVTTPTGALVREEFAALRVAG